MTKFEKAIAANPTLGELVDKGLLKPPRVEGGPIPKGEPTAPLQVLLEELDEIRADRV